MWGLASSTTADEATAHATLRLDSKLRLISLLGGDVDSPGLQITGDAAALESLTSVLDQPDPAFNIVTP